MAFNIPKTNLDKAAFIKIQEGYADQGVVESDISGAPDAWEDRLKQRAIELELLGITSENVIPAEMLAARDNKAVVTMGGDHPFLQWFGSNNGKNGLLGLYRKFGVNPYLATNTEAGYVQSPGVDPVNYMTWPQVKRLQDMGLEVSSHSNQHVQSWMGINTGVYIDYIGANAAPTVRITNSSIQTYSTELILAGAAGDAATIVLAGLTLTQLKAQVDAINGGASWRMVLNECLTGSERANSLWPVTTARNVATRPYSNAVAPGTDAGGVAYVAGESLGTNNYLLRRNRFAVAGGIWISYAPAVPKYRHVLVQLSNNNLEIFCDGVRMYAYAVTTGAATLNTVVAWINNNANIPTTEGFRAGLCEDDYTAATIASQSYIFGDERSVDFTNGATKRPTPEAPYIPMVFAGGLPQDYVRRRQFEVSVAKAAVHGVKLEGLTQPGRDLWPQLMSNWSNDCAFVRGTSLHRILWPYPQPLGATEGKFLVMANFQDTVDVANARAGEGLADAIADSRGHGVCILLHSVQPDGTSGFSLAPHPYGYENTEATLLGFLTRLKTHIDAGKVAVLTQKQHVNARPLFKKPDNLLFNPRFRCASNSVPLSLTSDQGKQIPGWRVTSNVTSGFTMVPMADGGLEISGAAASIAPYFHQEFKGVPGRRYQAGLNVEMPVWANGGAVRMYAVTERGIVPNAYKSNQDLNNWNYQARTGGTFCFDFSVPPTTGNTPPRVIGQVSETFNMSTTGTTIRLRINQDDALLSGDLSMGSSAGLTAKQVAANINTAIAADGVLGAYPELHNIARAERLGLTTDPKNVANTARVVLELPTKRGFAIDVLDGTTTGGRAKVFGGGGGNYYTGYSTDYGALTFESFPILLVIDVGWDGSVNGPAVLRLNEAWIREIENNV